MRQILTAAAMLCALAVPRAPAQYAYQRSTSAGAQQGYGTGRFGFTARHYAYGGYGAYQSRVPVTIRQPAVTPSRPVAPRVTGGGAISTPPALAVPASAPATPSLTTAYYYGFPGVPSTFYMPTVQSYVPYAAPGAGYTAFAAPVYAVTYAGGTTLSQTEGGAGGGPGGFNAQIGYPSYMNPRASWGQDLFPGLAPGQVAYAQSMQAALTPPGYYLNYIAAPGASYWQLHSSNPPQYTGIVPMDRPPPVGQHHALTAPSPGIPPLDLPANGVR